MNRIFNDNFVLGVILANDLPNDKKLTVGLTASQFPQNNMLGPLLLKPQLDDRANLEARKTALETANATLIREKTALAQANEALTTEKTALTAVHGIAQLPLETEIGVAADTAGKPINVTFTVRIPGKQSTFALENGPTWLRLAPTQDGQSGILTFNPPESAVTGAYNFTVSITTEGFTRKISFSKTA